MLLAIRVLTRFVRLASSDGDYVRAATCVFAFLQFEDMYVVGVYVPNAGEGLKRLDYRIDEV